MLKMGQNFHIGLPSVRAEGLTIQKAFFEIFPLLNYAYGLVSTGREKWPFNVLFFLKSLRLTKPDEIASFS